MDDGVPLPGALSGTVKERVIRLDDALFYLVAGALQFITDYQRYEPTGALTVEQTREALANMLWDFYTRSPMEIGTLVMWAASTVPDQFLLCDGSVKLQSQYPELHGVLGSTWNTGGEPSNSFRLPNLANRFPLGVSPKSLAALGGEENHQLDDNEMPVHGHGIATKNSTGGNVTAVALSGSGTITTLNGIVQTAGADVPHNNMPPYVVLNFIIKALP